MGRGVGSKGNLPSRLGHSGWVRVPQGVEPHSRKFEGRVWNGSWVLTPRELLAAPLSMCTREAQGKPPSRHVPAHGGRRKGEGSWTLPGIQSELSDGHSLVISCKMCTLPPPQCCFSTSIFLLVNHLARKTALDGCPGPWWVHNAQADPRVWVQCIVFLTSQRFYLPI